MARRSAILLATAAILIYFTLMLTPLHGNPKAYEIAQILRRTNSNITWCKEPRFRPAGPAAALASFPGSGNTWLRYLLQQATGILTGSVYVDEYLKYNGFPAENVTDGTVLVVKTHTTEPPPDKFKAAVLLVRNPRDTILARHNYQHMGHIGTAPRSTFIKSRGRKEPEWEKYVLYNVFEWERLHELWLTRFAGRVLVVLYDALVRDTRAALQDILAFLNHTVPEDDITCAVLNKEGIYRRRIKQNFDPFTENMYLAMEAARARVAVLIADHHRRHNVMYEGPSIVDSLRSSFEY